MGIPGCCEPMFCGGNAPNPGGGCAQSRCAWTGQRQETKTNHEVKNKAQKHTHEHERQQGKWRRVSKGWSKSTHPCSKRGAVVKRLLRLHIALGRTWLTAGEVARRRSAASRGAIRSWSHSWRRTIGPTRRAELALWWRIARLIHGVSPLSRGGTFSGTHPHRAAMQQGDPHGSEQWRAQTDSSLLISVF